MFDTDHRFEMAMDRLFMKVFYRFMAVFVLLVGLALLVKWHNESYDELLIEQTVDDAICRIA